MKLLTQKFRVKNRGGMISLKTGKMLLRKGRNWCSRSRTDDPLSWGEIHTRDQKEIQSLLSLTVCEPLFFGEGTGQSVTRENDEFFERLFP